MEYRVKGIPTFIYLVNGTEVRRLTGSTSKGMIRNVFRKPLF